MKQKKLTPLTLHVVDVGGGVDEVREVPLGQIFLAEGLGHGG